jgi:hypothetical protein
MSQPTLRTRAFGASVTAPIPLAELSLSDDEGVIASEMHLCVPSANKTASALSPHDGIGALSSNSMVLAALACAPSPLETPEASRTAVSSPQEELCATVPTALNIQRRSPEDAAFAPQLCDGESPCASKRLNSHAKRPVHRGASTAAVVKPPKHTWTSESGFAALAADLADAVQRGDYCLRLSEDGAGGTYFVYPRGDDAMPVAVFKPSNEEVGSSENPRGNDDAADDARFDAFEPGTGYLREQLAFELDHKHFAGVPQTVVVDLAGSIGSLQRFVPRMMQSWSTTPAKFDTASVHAIAVFDIRTLNCDRHGGNLLVRRDAPGLVMVPIDHGFILPEAWCDPDFEWAMWPQAKAPVSDAVRDYVAALDPEADAALVEARLGHGAAEVLNVTTRLLKAALAKGKTYTLRELADFCRRPTLTEPSRLEQLMTKCRRDLDEGGDVDMAEVEAALACEFP